MKAMDRPLIPNLDTLADLIDRLIVEVHKLAWFENKKREEHNKLFPDNDMIAQWDNLSRDCCEFRSLLKTEINNVFKQVVENKEYRTLSEVRTFKRPQRSVVDLLDEMCYNSAEDSLKGDLARAIKREIEK